MFGWFSFYILILIMKKIIKKHYQYYEFESNYFIFGNDPLLFIKFYLFTYVQYMTSDTF